MSTELHGMKPVCIDDHNAVAKLVAVIKNDAATRAYGAGLGASEWQAFLSPEAATALAVADEREGGR